MSFPPEFLEELRARLPVSEVVGKRLRLTRRGREYLGLCPFHNDTKPSLSVVDEKNFYHCFACGAHGDIISFVMGTEGSSFPETVERLAGEAGLEVPRRDPEARRREERRATLRDAMEAACAFYEQVLRSPEGRAGLDYLRGGRGLSDETIRAFRLGYAPAERTALRRAMAVRGIGPELLVEAGLLREPEGGGEARDWFRGRVVFPITDRSGRPVAFGGRTLGDGQPKYLNSPDTPLFRKGRVLYGLAQARPAAARAGEVVVAEGYMDAIALAQGGFPHVVAPLGTALTEEQIAELWRLAPEPLLCFDGDEAGRRAAARAAARALPLLRPGRSLRFVTLPAGEDPDDVLRRGGRAAMRELLGAAIGLADFVWEEELRARPLDTPERRADFARRVRGRVGEIADPGVREAYRDAVERLLKELREAARAAPEGRFAPPPGRIAARALAAARASVTAEAGRRRRERSVLAALAAHPALLEEFDETLGYVEFQTPLLDNLRHDLLETALSETGLDAAGLGRHLAGLGYAEECGWLFGPGAADHAAFARPGEPAERVRAGVRELLARLRKDELEKQLADAERAFASDGSETNWRQVTLAIEALAAVNAGASFGP